MLEKDPKKRLSIDHILQNYRLNWIQKESSLRLVNVKHIQNSFQFEELNEEDWENLDNGVITE